MAYSHFVRCPQCSKVSSVENRTPLWMLALKRVTFRLDCPHCNFNKRYLFLSSDAFEKIAVADDVGLKETMSL